MLDIAKRKTPPENKIWQDENHDHLIRNEKDYFEKLQYLLYNAVRNGLAASPFDRGCIGSGVRNDTIATSPKNRARPHDLRDSRFATPSDIFEHQGWLNNHAIPETAVCWKVAVKYLICSVFVYCLGGVLQNVQAQERSPSDPVQVYIGPLVSFLGVYRPAWGIGIEIGIKTKFFYAGAEYGINGFSGIHTNTELHTYDYQPSPPPSEDFLGMHGGAVISNSIFVGLVLLYNYQIPPYGGTGSWFNVGPDLRYQISDRLMLSTSYTVRRGLNSGISFIVW